MTRDGASGALSSSAYAALGGLVLAVAAVLRLYDLGGTSLWFDEIVYAMNSIGSLDEVVANTQTNNSSPLALPLLLMGVNAAAPFNEFAARLPSALFGIAAVGVMLMLPRAGVPRWTALAAAALAAIAQMQIYYSQEVREYALSILLSAWILFAGLKAGRSGPWTSLAIAGAAAPWLAYGPCFAYLAVLGWLGFYRLLGRFRISWFGLAASALAYFASAGVAYAVIASHQMGLGQQYYLLEHYLGASGLNPIEWIATNTGGVMLASLPGLFGVILGAIVVFAFIAKRLLRPLSLLDAPEVVLAAFIVVGMMLAGVLEIYPYGSPRHSVFMGPFLALAVAVAGADIAAGLKSPIPRTLAGGLAAAFAAAGLAAITGVTPGRDLHPALAKVADIRLYGEYQENRALMDYARSESGLAYYVVSNATPAHAFYGRDIEAAIGSPALINMPEPQADDILSRIPPEGFVVLTSHMHEGEVDAIIAALLVRGAAVERTFKGVRVEAFRVRPAA